MKKLLKNLIVCASIGVLSVAFLIGILALDKPKQYATSDINDYGHYIGNADNQFASKYISAFFPEIIESSFTDVTYSYRAKIWANNAIEANQELVIEDEIA